LNGKSTDPKAMHLRPGAARMEFRFTAPAMTAPERIRFRYQLTGVDADWVDAEKTRSAIYASLPPGKHIFRVVASNPEGEWSSTPATIGFSVTPYFWQTNWFLVAVGGLVAGILVWIARRATVIKLNRRLSVLRHEHALTRERARIAQDIHDELGANLTSIGLLADLGNRHKNNPSAAASDFSQISETARESVTAMDAIVWALNPRNDSLDHFANYVAQYTREFFRPANLRTRLEIPSDLPPQPMSPEVRHQLFLALKESFNNIVRHANATQVQFCLSCGKKNLHLRIVDDGKGFTIGEMATGQDGLINLRRRIEGIGGTFHIRSEAGTGTALDFTVPLEKLKTN
jgi:signal transduction histidine kinase